MDIASLPAEIAEQIGQNPTVERPFHGIEFETSIITSERGRAVLKIGRSARLGAELAAEQRVLVALAHYRPFVAAPLAFAVENGAGFSLLSYLPGGNLVEAVSEEDVAGRHALMAQFAFTLRRIHSWQTMLPQPADWLNAAIARATRHVESGQTENPILHPGRFKGSDPSAVLADLRRWRPTIRNELVFSHGDYCLPNVLVQEGKVSGVIDWPRGGYADRRFDLATAAWSIGYNLEDPAYVSTFLTAYGYDEPVETLSRFEALYVLT